MGLCFSVFSGCADFRFFNRDSLIVVFRILMVCQFSSSFCIKELFENYCFLISNICGIELKLQINITVRSCCSKLLLSSHFFSFGIGYNATVRYCTVFCDLFQMQRAFHNISLIFLKAGVFYFIDNGCFGVCVRNLSFCILIVRRSSDVNLPICFGSKMNGPGIC